MQGKGLCPRSLMSTQVHALCILYIDYITQYCRMLFLLSVQDIFNNLILNAAFCLLILSILDKTSLDLDL